MQYQIFQVDAFANEVFKGNPACVVPLKEWLPDDILLQIAKENAVAETAFFIDEGEFIQLRWFTPDLEMDLCGHATLATSFVIHSCLDYPSDEMHFKTMSGDLTVNYTDNRYHLDFPSRKPEKAQLPSEISEALNIQPLSVYKSRDYMLVYDNENEVKNIKIDRQIFDNINLGHGGVIVTSKGESVDFVSRFFTPQATILEDPVTGSAHCTLIPYWSSELSKKNLHAIQLSGRVGELVCKDLGKRVLIGGQAVLYSSGWFII
jgi:PhzF family phenazine biosynthesis protein